MIDLKQFREITDGHLLFYSTVTLACEIRYTRQTEGQNNDNPPSRKTPLREKY